MSENKLLLTGDEQLDATRKIRNERIRYTLEPVTRAEEDEALCEAQLAKVKQHYNKKLSEAIAGVEKLYAEDRDYEQRRLDRPDREKIDHFYQDINYGLHFILFQELPLTSLDERISLVHKLEERIKKGIKSALIEPLIEEAKKQIKIHALKAIADEPEYPTNMPDELWSELDGNRENTERAMKSTVRLTKNGITDRFLQALKEGK